MKREVRVLLEKATDSLFLSIDHFNRPSERGRHEAVLIFLDRAFELLLKAAVLHLGGKIRETRSSHTIGFDKCVRKCVSETKCLTEEEALTIQNINTLRDAAQHYVISLSEQHLYLHAQSGLTLFNAVLKTVFAKQTSDFFPERVLPITTSPPESLASVIRAEFNDVKKLVAPKSRKRLEALAKLRALAVLERSLAGERTQPSPKELADYVRQIRDGKRWTDIFPGVATLNLEASGSGFNLQLRLTKKTGDPVQLVPEGASDATVVGVRRVNELDFYSLGLRGVASKVGLTQPMTLAIIRALGLQEDTEYFKPIRVGSQLYKRYSQKAVERIKGELPALDKDGIWKKYNPNRWRTREIGTTTVP
jgi:hypothetical protein